jgi:N-acyl homoserine lactone hydrolase
MKLHAIQTGSVRIKTAQVEGRGRGLRRRLAIFADRDWTDRLPTYAWVIDHREGVIVVDTGQGTHLLASGKSLHPYVRWETAFRIDHDEEIGPQLRALGIGARDVKRVVLTHLHVATRPSAGGVWPVRCEQAIDRRRGCCRGRYAGSYRESSLHYR